MMCILPKKRLTIRPSKPNIILLGAAGDSVCLESISPRLIAPQYFSSGNRKWSGNRSNRLIILALIILIFCFFLFGLSFSPDCQAAESASLQHIIKKYAPNAAIALNDESGNRILSYHAEKVMIPASIIKLVVAQAAFDLLGKDYRFKTEFFLDSEHNLIIRGWGDPFLISEEIEVIIQALLQKNLNKINQIRLDDSRFSNDINIPGTSQTLNPYDALNGALVVNFNTIFVGRDNNGTVYSAEVATPLTPLAIKKAGLIKPGHKERINLTEDPAESLLYAGQLFSAFLTKAGIEIAAEEIGYARVDQNCTLLYLHHSTRSLESIFKGLMKYSNNFIANQIFLIMGAEKLGYPASLSKSREMMRDYLKEKWGIAVADMTLDEASGISRLNSMTADQMMLVLESFRENSDLLSEKNNLKIKSGTLTGIYNYAGYITTSTGVRPFVIMTKNKRNRRDLLLKYLVRYSNSNPIKSESTSQVQ